MIFQPIYNFFKNIKVPLWYKALMVELQEVILQVLLNVGKEFISSVQMKILDVSKTSMSSRDKFLSVFRYGKELLPSVPDRYLNLLIESLFSRLKDARVV